MVCKIGEFGFIAGKVKGSDVYGVVVWVEGIYNPLRLNKLRLTKGDGLRG